MPEAGRVIGPRPTIPMSHDEYARWKGWRDQPFGVCTRDQARYFKDELARCGVWGLAGVEVLEIGFGNGQFAAWATESGGRYQGIEVAPDLVSRGRAAGYDVRLIGESSSGLAASSSLDLVIAFDVLEHLPQRTLLRTLQDVKLALKPGGCLLARMPSGDSPFSGAIQFGDLTHRVRLGSEAVKQIALQVGLNVDQCREPAFPVRGLGIRSLVRRTLIAFVRRLGYLFIARVFMGGGSPVLTPNMVFVLRKTTVPAVEVIRGREGHSPAEPFAT